MAISIPQITKRAGTDTFIDVSPSMQGDSESKTFHYGKRIPSAIPKLRRSSACDNRYPGQAGTAYDFWEQTVTLLEAITHVPAPTRTGTPDEICNALLVHGIVFLGLKSLL